MKTWYGGDERRWKFDYKGLLFNLRRNFSGRWGFMTNYSLMWRNYHQLQWDTYDPRQFVYADSSDLNWTNFGIRWAFHLSAFYRLPWDVLVSGYVSGQSGIYIQDETGDYAWDATAPLVTISNGRRVSDIAWQARNAYYVGKKWGESGRHTDDVWNVNHAAPFLAVQPPGRLLLTTRLGEVLRGLDAVQADAGMYRPNSTRPCAAQQANPRQIPSESPW